MCRIVACQQHCTAGCCLVSLLLQPGQLTGVGCCQRNQDTDLNFLLLVFRAGNLHRLWGRDS